MLSHSSVGQKLDLTGLKSKSLLEPLGEDLVPDYSDRWQNSAPCYCRTKVSLFPCWPSTKESAQPLEATHVPWLVVLLPQVQSQQWRSKLFTRHISLTRWTQPLSLFKISCDEISLTW